MSEFHWYPDTEYSESVVLSQKRQADGSLSMLVLEAPDKITVSQGLVEEWEAGYYEGVALDGNRFLINNEVIYRITERHFRNDGFGFAYAVKEEDHRERGHI
jgi:hypothetical protein